jgi:predicted nucleic acid-binding protein
VSRPSLELAIEPGAPLLLDTTAVAAYLDTSEATHDVAREIIDEIVAGGRNTAAISAVTAMELLIRPLRAMPPTDHAVLAFLEHQPNLAVLPVDLEVARAAARIRAAIIRSARRARHRHAIAEGIRTCHERPRMALQVEGLRAGGGFRS